MGVVGVTFVPVWDNNPHIKVELQKSTEDFTILKYSGSCGVILTEKFSVDGCQDIITVFAHYF